MKLTHYSYQENVGQERHWEALRFSVEDICLLVGKNASGKSRILTTIFVLARLIAGKPPGGRLVDGNWFAAFTHEGKAYDYRLTINGGSIDFENLLIDGELFLERTETGEGHMWSSGINQLLSFKLPKDRPACARTDEIQYDYLVPLQTWGNSLKRYQFGSEFGRDRIYAMTIQDLNEGQDAAAVDVYEPEMIVPIYRHGFQKFGAEFDAMILRDLSEIGYDCTDVGAGPAEEFVAHFPKEMAGRIPVTVSVQERELAGRTRQFEMSTGMYRALALIINVNHAILMNTASTILVDDIGEGLDFERSSALINLVIHKCRNSDVQVLMSTNDRFVMNEVPLEYWHVVDRDKHVVRILDYDNSKKIFDDFKFLGLSNFDFFASQAYKH